MKKLNTTYLDNLVSKILKETLEERANDIVSKIKSESKDGSVCECGGQMYEGKCNECGSMYEDMSEEFDTEKLKKGFKNFGRTMKSIGAGLLGTPTYDHTDDETGEWKKDKEGKDYDMFSYANKQGADIEEGIYDEEDINGEFDYVQEDMVMGDSDNEELDSNNEEACKYHMEKFGPDNERTLKFCGSQMNESLKGRQRRLDRNKNNKIDAEDFKMLRQGKKSETDEGNAFTGALAQARKTGDKDFEVGGKKFETKEGKKFIQKAEKEIEKKGTKGDFAKHCGGEVTKSCIEKALKSGDPKLVKQANFAKNIKGYKGAEHKKSVKESYRLTETELVSMIEKIVKEQKTETVEKTKETKLKPIGGTPKGYSAYEKAHKGSGKENDDNIKAVTKKMNEYLKDGSKGDYDMNPKIFPKGNGEIEKMRKKAYIPSKAVEEYTDNLTAAGLENLSYDEIHPNDEWVNNNIVGSSKTGNNPEWANTGESDVNKKRKEIKDKNLLGQIKRKAYHKSPQPIVSDTTGEDESDKLMTKLESTTDRKQKQINEEFERMKSLIGYNRKTQ